MDRKEFRKAILAAIKNKNYYFLNTYRESNQFKIIRELDTAILTYIFDNILYKDIILIFPEDQWLLKWLENKLHK